MRAQCRWVRGGMHWPGRLRPPFEPFAFPAGMRRCGVTVVCCASSPTPPGRERPPGVSAAREADAKSYRETPPPLGLADLGHEPARIVARVGQADLALVVDPLGVDAPRGAYVLVLEAAGRVGGAASTREFAPGFRVSAGAHLLHLMPAELHRELQLASHGLEWAARRMPTIARTSSPSA